MTEEPDYIEIDVVPDLTAWHRLAEEPSRGLFQIMPSSWQAGLHAIGQTLQATHWQRTHSQVQYLKRLEQQQNWYANWFEISEHWLLESKLYNHFEQREWQNLQKLTALWITAPPQPTPPEITINHTWKA